VIRPAPYVDKSYNDVPVLDLLQLYGGHHHGKLTRSPSTNPVLCHPTYPPLTFSSLQVYGIKFALRGEELARQREIAQFSGTPYRLFRPSYPYQPLRTLTNPSEPWFLALILVCTLATVPTLPCPLRIRREHV
jgi:hypothetical protein